MARSPKLINVYCDESCHLQSNEDHVMALGAIYCPQEKTHEVSERIRELKVQYKIKKSLELKWSKVSPSKKDFYISLIVITQPPLGWV
ncbi:MAG: DUF3800 domain-containing protein [Candidatus Paracaedibacter sp.]